jgi:hypothetical protein
MPRFVSGLFLGCVEEAAEGSRKQEKELISEALSQSLR